MNTSKSVSHTGTLMNTSTVADADTFMNTSTVARTDTLMNTSIVYHMPALSRTPAPSNFIVSSFLVAVGECTRQFPAALRDFRKGKNDEGRLDDRPEQMNETSVVTVSYTHLTLPTSCCV